MKITDNNAKVEQKTFGHLITLSTGDKFVVLEQGEQGAFYKDMVAFDKKQGVAYIGEYYFDNITHHITINGETYHANLMPNEYTYDDFLMIAGGDERRAQFLFETVDWQSPESLNDELDDTWEEGFEQI